MSCSHDYWHSWFSFSFNFYLNPDNYLHEFKYIQKYIMCHFVTYTGSVQRGFYFDHETDFPKIEDHLLSKNACPVFCTNIKYPVRSRIDSKILEKKIWWEKFCVDIPSRKSWLLSLVTIINIVVEFRNLKGTWKLCRQLEIEDKLSFFFAFPTNLASVLNRPLPTLPISNTDA